MPSFFALTRASAALSASMRSPRIAGRRAVLYFMICLGFLAIPSARALNAGYSDALVVPPIAMTGMGLISSGDFSVTMSESEVGATTKLAGSALLTVTPADGFSQPVGFQCSGLPAGAACAFSPSTVTPGGAPATDTLVVSYAKPVASIRHNSSPFISAGVLMCTLIGCIRLRKNPFLLMAIVAIATLGTCTGCGSGNSDLRTYRVTLTAASGSLHHNVTFLLTVE